MRDTNTLSDLIKSRWLQYARLRFTLGERRERSAWAQFLADTEAQYREFGRRAAAAGARLDYEVEHVRLAVLVALEKPCQFCTKLYGLDQYALTYLVPPELGRYEMYAFRNVTVCCRRCADAKGMLGAREFIDVLAALASADERSATDAIDRLIAGQREKVLPDPRRLRVTREPQASASRRPKK